MLRYRRYLILLFASWLPVANAWPLLSPCVHGAPSQQGSNDAHLNELPCHGADSGQGTPDTCTHCAHCHLSNGASLPAAAAHALPVMHAVEHARAEFAHTLFIPKLPLPPPVF